MAKEVALFRDPQAQQDQRKAQQQMMLAQALMNNGVDTSRWNNMAITPTYGIGHALIDAGSKFAGQRLGEKAEETAASALMREQAAGAKARQEAMARILQGTVDESGAMGGGSVTAVDSDEGPTRRAPVKTSRPKSYEEKLADALAATEAGVPKELVDSFLKNQEAYTMNEGDTRFQGNQQIAAAPASNKPLDALAQLKADLDAGRIDLKDYMARRQLLTTRQAGTTVNVNTEKTLYGTMAEKIAAQNADLWQQAQTAPNLIERAQRVKKAINESQAITGAGANQLLSLSKVAAQLGFNSGDAASDTEALARDLAAATLEGIKASGLGAGSGFSNADREFLEKVVGGSITLEGQTLARLADLNERSAFKTMEKWNATASRLDPEQLEQLGAGPIQMPGGPPAKQPTLTKNPDGSFTYQP